MAMPALRSSAVARALRATVAVTLLVVVLAACSGGGSHDRTATPSTHSASASASRRTNLLTVGAAKVQRAGSRGVFRDRTRRAVLASAQRYVDRAILAPLETGTLGHGYAGLFVAGIRPAAVGPDRGVLTDLAAKRAATLTEQSTPVAFGALFDKSGELLYVSTTFSVKVRAAVPAGTIAINRTVELTWERVHASWLIAAYRIKVTRSAPVRSGAAA
jgi:hypothetical protein